MRPEKQYVAMTMVSSGSRETRRSNFNYVPCVFQYYIVNIEISETVKVLLILWGTEFEKLMRRVGPPRQSHR